MEIMKDSPKDAPNPIAPDTGKGVLPREVSSIFKSMERCKELQEEVVKVVQTLKDRLNPIIQHGPSVVKNQDETYISVNGLSPIGESVVGLELFLNDIKDEIVELEKSLDI